MSNEFGKSGKNHVPAVQNAKKIFIQTIEKVYMFDLLDDNQFKNCFAQWYIVHGHVWETITPFNMFHHLSNFGEEDSHSLFKNSRTLLASWYQSPYVNMFKVDPESKKTILLLFIQLDLQEASKGNHLIFDYIKKWHDRFFGNGKLLTCLTKEIGSCDDVTGSLRELIRIFQGNQSWKGDWIIQRDLRSMNQLLEYIDKNFLQVEADRSEPSIIDTLRNMFEETNVRQRINQMSSGTAAILELDNISKYLDNGFPLNKINGIKPPLTPLEELDLISYILKHSKIQNEYMKILGQIPENEKACKKEYQDHLKALIDKILRFRKRYSPGKLNFMVKNPLHAPILH